MCISVFALLGSSMMRSTSASVIFCYYSQLSGVALRLVHLCWWPPGEPEFCVSRNSFCRAIPNVAFLCGGVIVSPLVSVMVVGVTGDSLVSLSESSMLNIFGALMKWPSGPRSPVPLLFGYCVNSEMGLLMCFLSTIPMSDVVTVCLVPEKAV